MYVCMMATSIMYGTQVSVCTLGDIGDIVARIVISDFSPVFYMLRVIAELTSSCK